MKETRLKRDARFYNSIYVALTRGEMNPQFQRSEGDQLKNKDVVAEKGHSKVSGYSISRNVPLLDKSRGYSGKFTL